MLFYQLPTDRRVGFADAGKKQTQIFVNFGRSAHGGTWITARYFLLDSNGRWNAFDEIAFWFAHTSQELTGIAAKAFHVSTLSLGIKSIEGQG